MVVFVTVIHGEKSHYALVTTEIFDCMDLFQHSRITPQDGVPTNNAAIMHIFVVYDAREDTVRDALAGVAKEVEEYHNNWINWYIGS